MWIAFQGYLWGLYLKYENSESMNNSFKNDNPQQQRSLDKMLKVSSAN